MNKEKIENIKELIQMLREQKVYKFEADDTFLNVKIEFTAAAFYEEIDQKGTPEKDEDEDEILYHSV